MHRFAHFLRRGYASQRDHHRLRIFGRGGFNRFDVVVIERRNPLQLIILKQSELFRLEPLHRFSAAVGHLRVDQHEVGGRADHALARPVLFGVLVRFCTSQRRLMRSRLSLPKFTRRASAKLKLRLPGPGMVLRAASPKRPGGGSTKAAVLKKCSGVRWSPGSEGSPTWSARVEKVAPTPPLFPTPPSTRAVKGVPVCTIVLPLSVQLPNAAASQPLRAQRLRSPKGSS